MSSPSTLYAQHHRERFVHELIEFLKIPSISTLPQYAIDVQRAATFVSDQMLGAGLKHVRVIPTGGHPLVYGEWLGAPGKPTVLCYGHFDVLPPDPLDEWTTPPFEPAVRGGNIYARGAADDKGQSYIHLKAVEALLKTGEAKLPVNVRILMEGEEEIGGKAVSTFIREHARELQSDCALISDTAMFAPELPTLCVGLRGTVSTEVNVRGPKTDLHSGGFGGVAPNPLFVLAQIISRLKDGEGKICIPHFYDRVEQPSVDELKAWERLPFDIEDYRKNKVGARDLAGEKGYSILQRRWARPTLDVHGIAGGFTGEGAKMVIPARASAKISMRIVPKQRADEVFKLYAECVQRNSPPSVDVDVRCLSMTDPIVIPTENQFIQAAKEAMQRVFQKAPVFTRTGGSIPVVTDFQEHLRIPSILMGFGLPDDNPHAPNEKFLLSNFYRGIESVIYFLELVGDS
jgi:acetylornithine deacetylase/succinyl-diaminopimelate desuccinylase-like protein